MAGRPLERGDIVLAPFPFTDLTARKVRPAIIVSANPQGRDLVLAFISSVVPPPESISSDFLLHSTHPDFHATGLKRSSVFKMGKLVTLERSHVLRRLGRVSQDLQKYLDQCLLHALSLKTSIGP